MYRYMIFILIFNTLCFAKKIDINKKNENKAINSIFTKRELPNVEATHKDLTNINDQQEVSNLTNKFTTEDQNKANTNKPNNDTSIFKQIKINNNNEHSTKDPWAAALRGFYVFLGLSIIIIVYFIIKSFRLRPGAAPPTTVRKYGIVGRRSDMEMLPLPLTEDEDDDTVFDVGSQINR